VSASVVPMLRGDHQRVAQLVARLAAQLAELWERPARRSVLDRAKVPDAVTLQDAPTLRPGLHASRSGSQSR